MDVRPSPGNAPDVCVRDKVEAVNKAVVFMASDGGFYLLNFTMHLVVRVRHNCDVFALICWARLFCVLYSVG